MPISTLLPRSTEPAFSTSGPKVSGTTVTVASALVTVLPLGAVTTARYAPLFVLAALRMT